MEPPRTDEVKIAVLEEQMKSLRTGLDAVATKIDSLTQKIDDAYVKKEDFNKFLKDDFSPVKQTTEKLWWNLALLIGGGGVIITLVNWYLISKHP